MVIMVCTFIIYLIINTFLLLFFFFNYNVCSFFVFGKWCVPGNAATQDRWVYPRLCTIAREIDEWELPVV